MASQRSIQSWIAVVLRKGAWEERKFWMYRKGKEAEQKQMEGFAGNSGGPAESETTHL